MARHIGLDAHSTSCRLAVVGVMGKRLGCQVVETHAKRLVDLIKTIPRPRHVCFEEGTHSAWLYEILLRHVDQLDVTTVRQSRGPMDDERDAFDLADKLRTNSNRLKSPLLGYAPPECRTKQWAEESLTEGWFPLYRGEQDCFIVAGNANETRTPKSNRRGITTWQSPATVDPRSPWLERLAGFNHLARQQRLAVGCKSIRSDGLVCLDTHPHRRRHFDGSPCLKRRPQRALRAVTSVDAGQSWEDRADSDAAVQQRPARQTLGCLANPLRAQAAS